MSQQVPDAQTCPNCGEPRGRERVCGACGSYLPRLGPSAPEIAAPEQMGGPQTPAGTVPGADIDDPFGSRDVLAALSAEGGSQPAAASPPAPPVGESRSVPATAAPGADALRPTPGGSGESSTSGWRLRLADPVLEFMVDPGSGVLLGRDPRSPISAHPSVSSYTSSQHARVWLDPTDPGVAYILDMSTNGTWVSGIRLVAGVRNVLRDGDVIRLAAGHPVTIEVLR